MRGGCGGSGCGVGCSETQAWAPGPDQWASDGVRLSAPYIFYIYARCHCGGPRNGAGIRQCHLETDGNNDMHWHLRTKAYHIVISVPTPMPNATIFRYFIETNAPGSCDGSGRVGVRDGPGNWDGSPRQGPPWVVSPIPLQGALAMGRPGRHQRDCNSAIGTCIHDETEEVVHCAGRTGAAARREAIPVGRPQGPVNRIFPQ